MFQLNAQSFVGAAGPWQFMPATGREYMTLSRVIDERHDPIIATRAAARYLRSAKRLLEEWPLAVTSYNYGMGGMRKAARQTESTDLVQIFKKYKGKRMGFAARNYYAEFLAALHVLERSESCFAGLQLEPKWSYELVTLDRDVKATDLYAAEVFNARALADLNPGLRKEALAGTVDLPVGMQLRVPEGMAEHFMTGLAMLQPPSQDSNIDAEMKTHRVRPGDNVTRIAQRHGVSVRAVLAANNIKPHDVIYPDMLLRIPQTTPSSSLRSE
jgi:membrane-bound lytic murein transglycosylase D